MGTSRSAAEFSQKLRAAAEITQIQSKQIIEQAALTGKEIVLAEAAAKGVRPESRIAGGRWGVRYDTKGHWNPTALLRIFGPFHLVDRDTRKHRIYRRAQRVRGRGSTRMNKQIRLNQVFGAKGAYTGGSLKFHDGGFRKVADHPGTTGKGIWAAAKQKINVAVPVVMSRRVIGGWRQVFR